MNSLDAAALIPQGARNAMKRLEEVAGQLETVTRQCTENGAEVAKNGGLGGEIFKKETTFNEG